MNPAAVLLLATLVAPQRWDARYAVAHSARFAGTDSFRSPALLLPYLRPSRERIESIPWLSSLVELPLELAPPCSHEAVKSVSLRRPGGERDTLRILDCAGGIATGALDRVSVLARAPRTHRPALPLPLTPVSQRSMDDEWMDGVKLLRPRLLWMLQGIADQFPGRVVTLHSGFRRDRATSRHRQGRALDISISGVSNAELFRVCRTYADAGCGFYPNSSFVHVDVRAPGTGHAVWVDTSGPGEPSEYVDGWPGVIASGGLAWRRPS